MPGKANAAWLMIALISCGCAQHQFPGNLFPVRQNNKIGYVDTTGNYVIPPRFPQGQKFSEGLAAVVDDKWGQRAHQQWGYVNPKEPL